MLNIQSVKNRLWTEKGKLENIEKSLEEKSKAAIRIRKEHGYNEKAQVVIQEVAKLTQQKIKEYIEDLVSMAMASIFEEPYKFRIEFVLKRGQTEAELYFERDGSLFRPSDSSGGGTVDVASFVLRLALLTLKLDTKNKTLILDEPLKWVSKEYIQKAGEILKKLAHDLGYQVIIVTHIPELMDYSDRTFILKNSGGVVDIEVEDLK